jgi:hypothetical protein
MVLVCLGICSAASPAEDGAKTAASKAISGILYNEDDSNRFMFDPPGQMKPERLDKLVDELANSHVTIMLVNCNAKKTNFQSKSWEPHCEGFDPTKDDKQPYFGDTEAGALASARQWAHNLKVMLDAGVDPTGRMLERCRRQKISPWVSIRMNDVHDAHLLNSALHSRFWKQHHEYWRYPDRFKGWNDRCLNYALKPVRDYAMSLVREVCERYDMDGLELDWNRFPLHFREGEEIEGGKLLTEWMGEVRQVVRAAEKKWKHPILLAARVPARPEVSMGTGLDAVTWAKRGLIDHLIVAPFWATTDFDIPVERWIGLLKGTGVGVTAGLEANVRAYPGAPVVPNTPERRRGAAMAALARGSQGIYVFNYFEVGREMPYLLKELDSIDTLERKDRSYPITFVDINVPGQSIPPALPKKLAPGESTEFRVFIGPKPVAGARGEVSVSIDPEKRGESCGVEVKVNGQPAGPVGPAGPFKFGREAFQKDYNTIGVTNSGQSPLAVTSVELSVRF